MRKHLILILILTLSISSCKKNNTFIEGTVKMGDKKMLYLDYLNINKTETIDSMKIKRNGLFGFSINLEYPGIYLLRNDKGEIISLLPHPGEKLWVETNYDNFDKLYSVSGSKESEYIRQLVEKLNDTRDRLNKLDETLGSLSNTNEEQAREYINRRKEIIKEQRDFSIHFIIEHLNSVASIYALYQTISPGQYVLGENRDIQYMKIVADSVSTKYPEAPFVKSFVADARSSEQKFYTVKALNEKIKSGNLASTQIPDLIIPDTKGDSISLTSLKGKIVLLYFWASQSEDSRKMNLSLKKIYDKNREKGFEVYAVALEKDKDQWKKTIRFEELDWINVNELTFPASRAAMLYNVTNLPTSFLINKQGDIVARDIYGSELQKWLDNLL
jgi:peroxiredoxin